MRQLVGGRAVKHGAASASAMGRFETEILTQAGNLAVLAELPGRWIDAVHAIFQMAEAALPRQVFAGLAALINGLRGPPVEAASA